MVSQAQKDLAFQLANEAYNRTQKDFKNAADAFHSNPTAKMYVILTAAATTLQDARDNMRQVAEWDV